MAMAMAMTMAVVMTMTPLAVEAVQWANGRRWSPLCAGAFAAFHVPTYQPPTTRPACLPVCLSAAPGQTRLMFEVPSRGLMGFGAEIRQETHGSAVVNSTFV